jgi:hypothetical protein
MREAGRYQLQLMKTRSSSGVGMKIDLAFDMDTLRISDLDDAEEIANNKPTSTLMDTIKQRALAQKDDTTYSTKTRTNPVSVEGSKLRQLISALNTPDM